MAARLLAVNVGLPREMVWRGQTVRTSIWKQPVEGKRMVRRLNIDGDAQADLTSHGGEHRAVFVYQIDSYQYWQDKLHRTGFTFGQFGENFTVEGLADAEVCIGDRYRIGSALFEVTQPRVTCYRVGIRMDEPQMPHLLVSHGRPGFYFRVLQEGEVEAGDEIIKIAAGPEGMSIAEINRLLYLPGHPREKLERALRIPALPAGWRESFQSLLEGKPGEGAAAGEPNVASAGNPAPASPGFHRLRVAQVRRESDRVVSLEFEPANRRPLAVALPGQFVVLRLHTNPEEPALLRSYSLCGPPSSERYRLGVKRETHGTASVYLTTQVKVGDMLEVSAPSGRFVLQAGQRPVVFLSAGIGVTPLLAMLHHLAMESPARMVWWLRGVTNGSEDPFAGEVRLLLSGLRHSAAYICYRRPLPEDKPGAHFDAVGRLDVAALEQLGVSREADFYLCGPTAFLRDFTAGLTGWDVPPDRVHTEIFGPGESETVGIVAAPARSPHAPFGTPGKGPLVSFARSGLNVPWDPTCNSLLEFAETCDVPVRWACRSGVCHSCETALVAGAIDYDPSPLEPPASGNLLLCCSRPRGEVILDL
jgi:ferredoxin-NADP reductase/MOSC domain-containing protein YiiM/ferredoxin